MQGYPQHRQQPPPPPLYRPNTAHSQSTTNLPLHRIPRKLRSAMKRTQTIGASTTHAVWGGSTRPSARDIDTDSSSDSESTTTAGSAIEPSPSIASFQSQAPWNKPAQQHRVANWVHDTEHYAPKFNSPFIPSPVTSGPTAGSRHHRHSHGGHGHKHSHASSSTSRAKREPPPVWVPQSAPVATAPVPPRLHHTTSQPMLAQQYYQQQQQWQYVQPQQPPPTAVQWAPAPANQIPGAIVPPPASTTLVITSGHGHRHGKSKVKGEKSKKKRAHS